MKIAFNPSTVAALTTPPNNKDITFDLRGRNIFARGVKFYGTDTNTWRDIKINNVSIGSHTLDLRNGSNTTLSNANGVVTINSTWRPVVDNLTSDSTTSSLSAKQGKVLKGLIDGKSNSGHTHDDRYLKLTGGTMTGNIILSPNVEIIKPLRSTSNYDTAVSWSVDGETKQYGREIGLHNTGGNDSTGSIAIIPYKTSTDPWSGTVGLFIAKNTLKLDGKPIALKSDLPSSLKNPYSLTLQANGTTLATYDGSVSKIVNLTYDNVGAAAKNHTHNSLEPWASYINGDSHAAALKSIFNKNKTSIPRNKFISMLSSAYGNGSYYMGYFLYGYENNPYGGFFVAHYDAAYYIGVSNGSFSQHRLVYSTDIPSSLKNPHALTISLNGTSQGPYDGSATKNINITPGSIGAATSGHNHDDRYLKLTGGTMLLGEGLKFHADNNYFGTNADARIISLLDDNDKVCDGGLIIDERGTLNGKEYVTELLRIRDSEFKWKGSNILHSGNYSSILDSRYYTESEVNSLLSKKLNTSDFNWTSLPGKIVAGNEFNIVNAGFKDGIWFNYLPINDRNKTAVISNYSFGNGAQGYASVTASGFIKKGSSSSYVLLGDGGHKTESSLNVANADTVDGVHVIWGGSIAKTDWLAAWENQKTIRCISPANVTVGNADKVDGFHATSNNNKPWGTIPVINTSGYMDIGKHLEFHYDNTTGSDYSTALMCQGNYSNIVYLPSASGTLALTSQVLTWKSQIIDMRNYSGSYWHPVTVPLPYTGYNKIKVSVQLNSGDKPSWAEHSSGITCNMEIWATASGWGTTNSETICLNYTYKYCSQNPCGWGQLGYPSLGVLFLRGGSRYRVYTDFDATFTPHDQKYTWTNGSYSQNTGPYTSCPGLNFNKNKIYANLDGYATTAGSASYVTLTYCRDDSSPSNKGLWNTIKNGTSSAQTNKVNFYTIYNSAGGPSEHGEMMEILSYNANHWQPQLWFGAGKTGGIYYRNKSYNDNTWGSWRTVAFTSQLKDPVNYYWANIKVSASSNSGTSPTFSTAYTSNWFRSSGNTGWYNQTYGGGINMTDSTWIRTYGGKPFYCDNQIYSSDSIRMGNIYLQNSDEINNRANGGLHLNYRNTGNVTMCVGGGRVGIGTASPSYELQVAGSIYSSDYVIARSSPSSWLDGQRYNQAGYNLQDVSGTGAYYPWMRQTNTGSAKWFSIGILNNSFYILGSKTSRTENSYDYAWRFDLSNGWAYGNFSNADTVDGVHLEWSGSLTYDQYSYLAAWTNDGKKIKAVNKSQFASSGHTHSNYVTALGTSGNYLTWVKNGSTNNITVPYATTSSYLTNGFSATYVNKWDCNAPDRVVYSDYGSSGRSITNAPSGWNYGTLLELGHTNYRGLNSALNIQLMWDVAHGTTNPGTLWFRGKDNVKGWAKSWAKVITDQNISSILSSYYTKSESDGKYVTLATTQTIGGSKTFTTGIKFNVNKNGNANLGSGDGFKLFYNETSGSNFPGNYYNVASFMTGYTGFQLACYGGSDQYLKYRHRQDDGTWHPWKTLAFTTDIPNKNSWNYDDRYLKLTGGTMNANARISHDNGNLYIGRADNNGWVYTQDIASHTGSDKWNIRTSGAACFGSIHIASKTDASFNANVIECATGIYLNYFSSQNVSLCSGGGKVGIGTSSPGSYKLSVNGSAQMKSITLQAKDELYYKQPICIACGYVYDGPDYASGRRTQQISCNRNAKVALLDSNGKYRVWFTDILESKYNREKMSLQVTGCPGGQDTSGTVKAAGMTGNYSGYLAINVWTSDDASINPSSFYFALWSFED